MSYPDLGCFAECLECELCGGLDDEGELDLDFDWDDYDRVFGDDLGLDDWAPPEEEGDWWGDFEVPPVYPTAEPTDGGWIFGVGGRF